MTKDVSWLPKRLLLVATGWLALAVSASFSAQFVLGFAAGFLEAVQHGAGAVTRNLKLAVVPVGGITLQSMLLIGARRYGRAPNAAGLGWNPIRRPGWLAALIVLQLLATVLWAAAFISLLGAPSTIVAGLLLRSVRHAPALFGVLILLALFAPVCEELFFRGWLWAGLRQRFGPVRTAVVTAAPWLLLHVADGGWRRVVMLVPAAVFFSLGRHQCDSVRASIVMHISNNAIIAVLAVVLATARR